MRAVFRVDANFDIGWGHLVRATAIADELTRRGWKCILATRSDVDTPGVRKVSIPDGVMPGAEGEFLGSLALDPDVVIGDVRHPTQEQVTSLCSGEWASVFVDDDSTVAFDCDLVINPNLSTVFEHRISARTAYLRGGEYLILRPQFEYMGPHETRPDLGHLVICFGGSDPAGVTGRILSWYGSGGLPASITRVSVVVGQGAAVAGGFDSLASDPRFVVLHEVEDMAGLMADADAGVLAAGTLAYEALAAGLPAALVSLDAAQSWEARAIAAHGAALDAGSADEFERAVLDRQLADLRARDARSGMSLRGQSMVDGRGRERVADAISEVVVRRSV